LTRAWIHIAALIQDTDAPKPLLLAAIGALVSIRPEEAPELLIDLASSDDEEIAEAVDEAIAMADAEEEDEEEDEGFWSGKIN
jgi:hypothetical protein